MDKIFLILVVTIFVLCFIGFNAIMLYFNAPYWLWVVFGVASGLITCWAGFLYALGRYGIH